MNLAYFEDKVYTNETFTLFPLGEYENCRFISCDFSEADLSSCVFLAGEFVGCNLSMVKISEELPPFCPPKSPPEPLR